MDKGFSLIELVIVIAIIGIITILVLPNYSIIQNRAKLTALTSAGHTIQTAVESYNLSTGSYPVGQELTADPLFAVLQQSGDMRSIPKNPYTGAPFSSGDTAGKIAYTYAGSTQSYEIKLYAGSTGSPAVVLTNY